MALNEREIQTLRDNGFFFTYKKSKVRDDEIFDIRKCGIAYNPAFPAYQQILKDAGINHD